MLVFFGVLLLAVLYVFGLRAGGTGGEQMERVDTPAVEQTTTEVTDEQTIAEEKTM